MQSLYGWFRRHPTLVDSAWALVVLGLSVLEMTGNRPEEYERWYVLGGVSVSLCTLLALRRRWTDAAVLIGAGIGVLQLVLNLRPASPDLVLLALIYTAGACGSRWISRFAIVAGVAAGPLTAVRWAYHPPTSTTTTQVLEGLLFSTPFVACWVLGRLTRTRRAYYAELEDRAARLERERDAQSKVAVAAERARIARELHDVVAHNVSVMIVQADGAAYVMESAPDQAKQALETISSTGRQALEEMRRLLGVLRSSDAGGEYVPQPGVEQLPDLLEQVRSAGLPVVFAVEGEPRPLPRGVELTAYRIVQEALTNARKHAGPGATATVRVRFDSDGLDLAVEDDGRGSTDELARTGGQDGLGHGLIGMRERVGMIGGTLQTGPLPGGGFGITVRLPLHPEGRKRSAVLRDVSNSSTPSAS